MSTHGAIVIGLGNIFLGDDGFGPLALELFRCAYDWDDHVEVMDLGTPGLDLAPYLYGRRIVIIVDAVHTNLAPNTLSVFREAHFMSSQAKLRITGHDPGLWDSLAHLRLAEGAPAELIVIGLTTESCEFGGEFSDTTYQRAAEAGCVIAGLLDERGYGCYRRDAPAEPNLWWVASTPANDPVRA